MREQPKCPECEKLASVSSMSNEIGAFIDWLRGNEMDIVGYNDDGNLNDYPEYIGNVGINRLLARYYGIDLDKVEKERKDLLNWLREHYDEQNKTS